MQEREAREMKQAFEEEKRHQEIRTLQRDNDALRRQLEELKVLKA